MPLPGQTVEFRPLTEADVRRIVREEIERFAVVSLQGQLAREEMRATKDQAP